MLQGLCPASEHFPYTYQHTCQALFSALFAKNSKKSTQPDPNPYSSSQIAKGKEKNVSILGKTVKQPNKAKVRRIKYNEEIR